MNAFGVIFRYLQLKKISPADRKRLVPRLSVFAGKAAPGYHIAKLIIKLINSISKTINADEEIREYLSVAFLPDYAVSLAQILVPASDIHEHISTAGTEASSPRPFLANGALELTSNRAAGFRHLVHEILPERWALARHPRRGQH